MLFVRERGSGTREVVAQALAAQRVEPKRSLEIGSTEAIKQAVAAGLASPLFLWQPSMIRSSLGN